MVKKAVVMVIILVFLVGLFWSLNCSKPKPQKVAKNLKVREPVFAGAFYPGSKEELQSKVDEFLNKANLPKIKGRIVGIIVPHAGYVYSGQVAAFAYKQLKGQKFETAIIMGPSHRVPFAGAGALPEEDYFKTPLGQVKVDKGLVKALTQADKKIEVYPPAHRMEHCLEVQLPFLQRVLDKFDVVPIVTGELSLENCKILGKSIVQATKGKSVLLVASSDMSHYPAYEDANKVGKQTLKAIESFDPQKVINLSQKLLGQNIPNLHCTLCGETGVVTVMMAAKALGAGRVKVLKYANSGDVPIGDKSGVVGYCAVIFYQSMPEKRGGLPMLNEKQEKRLLEIARKTMETYVRSHKVLEVTETDPVLTRNCGAFVTIKKHDQLRGCIGHIIGRQPLYLTVRDMAIAASTQDPRFLPVTPDELDDIEIEISVLSEPQRVSDVEEIQMGVHGVIVERGGRSGVFLPQVATETGWTREEFLSNLCSHKAGLPPDAWKDKDTEIYTFTAQVFHEKK